MKGLPSTSRKGATTGSFTAHKPASDAKQTKRTRSTAGMPRVKVSAGDKAEHKGEAEALEGSTEAALWGGKDVDQSLPHSMAEVEQRLAQHEAAAEAEAKHTAHDAPAEPSEHTEKQHERLTKTFDKKPNAPEKTFEPKVSKQATFNRPGAKAARASTSQVSASQMTTAMETPKPVNPLRNNKLVGNSAKPERPPDAFALLREARDAGVFFHEDGRGEGAVEREDPELAAAVEEVIQVLFGVRGILRVGPGTNDKEEAIIVVSTTNGFSEAGLSRVPKAARGFATVVAVPFELLPLRRDRP